MLTHVLSRPPRAILVAALLTLAIVSAFWATAGRRLRAESSDYAGFYGPLFAGILLGSGRSAADVLLVLIPITLFAGIMCLLVVRLIKSGHGSAQATA